MLRGVPSILIDPSAVIPMLNGMIIPYYEKMNSTSHPHLEGTRSDHHSGCARYGLHGKPDVSQTMLSFFLFLVACGRAQQIQQTINATALGLLGPILTQWIFSSNSFCSGGAYESIVLVPGCNSGIRLSDDKLTVSFGTVQRFSTFLHNCTGEYPFNFGDVEYYNSTRNCSGEFVAATLETGQCEAETTYPNSRIFQWKNYSYVPDTGFMVIAQHENTECRNEHEPDSTCYSYDSNGNFLGTYSCGRM